MQPIPAREFTNTLVRSLLLVLASDMLLRFTPLAGIRLLNAESSFSWLAITSIEIKISKTQWYRKCGEHLKNIQIRKLPWKSVGIRLKLETAIGLEQLRQLFSKAIFILVSYALCREERERVMCVLVWVLVGLVKPEVALKLEAVQVSFQIENRTYVPWLDILLSISES